VTNGFRKTPSDYEKLLMKILITGVLGVVGSKLEEILVAKNYNIFGINLFHVNKNYDHGLGKLKDNVQMSMQEEPNKNIIKY
jgi:GDP-D-mannose dehydratase